MNITTERTFYSNGQIKTECQVLNGKKHGRYFLYHENGVVAIIADYIDGMNEGAWREWYENGQLAEEGVYVNNEYNVTNFWKETGEQSLKDGTGTVIRKFGASDGDVFEQYFDNGQFQGEKKLTGVTYGKFHQNENQESR